MKVFIGVHPQHILPCVCTIIVVIADPFIKIVLQFLDGPINLFSECSLIELVQDYFVELLAYAVSLRMLDLGFSMLNVI